MKKLYFLVFMLFSINTTFAQRANDLWLFGTSAGIKFDHATKQPSIITKGTRPNYNLEGCAILNDPITGDLLFYTDGSRVYNSMDQLMENGDTLGGNAANSPAQAAAIVAFPDGRGEKFYIFSNTTSHNNSPPAPGSLLYSIVDMTANGGLGKVITKNQLIRKDIDEGMIAISNIEENKYWIVTHLTNQNRYISIPVTLDDKALKDTTKHNAFTLVPPDNRRFNSSYSIKYSPVNGKIAISCWTPQRVVASVDFDKSSGVISNFHYYDTLAVNSLNDRTTSQVIGIEWSPDGTKLYASTLNTLQVYQYDLSNNDKRTSIYSDITAGQAGAMELGPDGKIYHRSVLANPNISVINKPNLAGAACNYTAGSFTGLTEVQYYNFPQHCEYIYYKPMISPAGTVSICLGSTTDFSVNEGVAWKWSTGDTTKSIVVNKPGSYSCMVKYPNGVEVLSNTVTVTALPQPIANAGADASIACGSTTTLTATASSGMAPYTYQWIGNTVTGATYSNVSPGTYIVQVTDAKGCKDFDTVEVNNSSSSLNATFNNSATPCAGKPVDLSLIVTGASGNVSYLWSTGETTASITVTTPKDSAFTVKITDAAGCTITKSTLVKVSPLAKAAFSFDNIGFNYNFHASGANGITKWTWDFDDRTPESVEQDPMHVFGQPGTFNVKLIVENQCGTDTIITPLLVDGKDGSGTAVYNNRENGIVVYPNPFYNKLNVVLSTNGATNASYKLFDAVGKIISQTEHLTPERNTIMIDIDNSLLSGHMYYLQVQVGNKIYSKKLLSITK